jgi:hypothetical protein
LGVFGWQKIVENTRIDVFKGQEALPSSTIALSKMRSACKVQLAKLFAVQVRQGVSSAMVGVVEPERIQERIGNTAAASRLYLPSLPKDTALQEPIFDIQVPVMWLA